MAKLGDSRSLSDAIRSLYEDRRNSAWRGLLLAYLGIFLSIYAIIMRPNGLTYAVAFFLIGVMQYHVVISCHEAVHKTLLFPLWLNECVGWLNCALVGINFPSYRQQHFNHHWASQIDNDPDAYIYRPFIQARPGLHRMKVWLLGTFGEIIEKFRQKGSIGGNAIETSERRLHALFTIVINGVIFALFYLWINRWAYFTFWLLPDLTIALFLNRTRVIVEHAYPHGNDPGKTQGRPQLTVDVASNPLERFFVAPFCFNFHYSHHRVPSIPHYNNEKLSDLLTVHGDPGMMYVESSYLRLLIRSIRPC